jgi:hypothetical protein
MKMALETPVVLLAIACAAALWIGLIELVAYFDFLFIWNLKYWISHLSVTGWLFFVILAISLSNLFLKLARRISRFRSTKKGMLPFLLQFVTPANAFASPTAGTIAPGCGGVALSG